MKMLQHQKMLEQGVLSNDSDADASSSLTVTGINGASAGSSWWINRWNLWYSDT